MGELASFATSGRALTSVFRILLGDFGWEELAHVGLSSSNFWFWSFIVVVQLIMLNMLLAIVMDVYMEVKGGISEDAETIWSQTDEIIRRFFGKIRGRRLSLERLYVPFDKKNKKNQFEVACNNFLTPKPFMDLVPGLTRAQASRILTETMHNARAKSLAQRCSNTMDKLVHIACLSQQIHDYVKRQIRLEKERADGRLEPMCTIRDLYQAEKRIRRAIAMAPDTVRTSAERSVLNQEPDNCKEMRESTRECGGTQEIVLKEL